MTGFEKYWGIHTGKCWLENTSCSLSQTFSPYKYANILKLSHSSYLPTYEDGTECSETSAYKIQTPGNYSKKKHTAFRTLRKFEIKNVFTDLLRSSVQLSKKKKFEI
jgi:hypothetical protein